MRVESAATVCRDLGALLAKPDDSPRGERQRNLARRVKGTGSRSAKAVSGTGWRRQAKRGKGGSFRWLGGRWVSIVKQTRAFQIRRQEPAAVPKCGIWTPSRCRNVSLSPGVRVAAPAKQSRLAPKLDAGAGCRGAAIAGCYIRYRGGLRRESRFPGMDGRVMAEGVEEKNHDQR